MLKTQISLEPSSEKEVEEILRKRRMNSRKVIAQASSIKEGQFEKYSPLVEDLRHDSLVSMFSNIFITVRRLLMLYLAMFIVKQQWSQVLSFMAMNLISLCFLVIAMPFENSLMNYVGLFNEGIALFISYLIAQMNDLKYDPKTTVHIGNLIVDAIYFSWLVNGFIVLYVGIRELFGKLRNFYRRRLLGCCCRRAKTERRT